MEILNNIWIALSTPNEGLVSLILIPATFIENLLCLLLIISTLNITIDKKQKIAYVLLTSILGLIGINFIPQPFNFFINYIFSMIIVYYILKANILQSILIVLLSTGIFALVGTLVLNPYLTLLNITYEQSATIPIYRLGYFILMYSTIFIITLILKLKHLKISILDDIDKKNKRIIIANLLLGLFTLFFQVIITFYYIETLPINITFLSFICLLAYFTISIYSLTRVVKLILTTRKLESAEEYNKTLRVLHDSVRGFKHDFDNIVTTIGGYVRTNDVEGLKKYYVELEDDCQRVNNLYLLNPEIINNPRYL